MVNRHPGWRVEWAGHREYFFSPEGLTYVRTNGDKVDLELDAFVVGRKVKLRRINMKLAEENARRRDRAAEERESARRKRGKEV